MSNSEIYYELVDKQQQLPSYYICHFDPNILVFKNDDKLSARRL